MTKAAEIRRAIKRTQRYRDWFKRTIPKKSVDLDAVLEDPTQHYRTATEVALSKPPSKLISCGTIGCVMGWLRAFPDMKRRIPQGETAYSYLGTVYTGDDSVFDACHTDEMRNQKAAAIKRLNYHIKDLRQVLKSVA